MSASPVIGIRDSGVGGLTVARCIRRLLPTVPLLYFADTAHVPYGERSPEEVRHYALSISGFLLTQGAQILVFACNTSSAYALDLARSKFTQPIVGMIEPGTRSALQASRDSNIGVLATHATVESHVYTTCLQRLKPGTQCIEVACPEFVPLVENEQTCSEAAYHASQSYLQPLLKAGVDTVILGCTHYPLLLPALREVAPQLCFVDPAEAVAAEVVALLENHSQGALSSGSNAPADDIFYVSGPNAGVRHWVQKLMPQSHVNGEIDIQRGPVFDL